MKSVLRIAALAALALALPASAQASLPNPHSTLIVPNHSLAGVKLGATYASAAAAWDKGGTCSPSGCSYSTPSGRTGTATFLIVPLVAGGPARVVSVSIAAGLLSASSPKHNYHTPLARFQTPSGIGIGSTIKQLMHAYPHAKKQAGALSYYTILGPGKSFTLFSVSAGRVEGIRMQSVPLG